MNVKALIFSISTLALSVNANSAPIQPSDIVFTSGDGTQWLSLSLTIGVSLDTALNAYDGYTIATKDQFDSMFSNFTPIAPPSQTTGNYDVYNGFPSQALSFGSVHKSVSIY